MKSNDIAPLDCLIENMIFSKYDENDIHLVSEEMHVKLVRIFQFVVEYLLQTNSNIEHQKQTLENNYKLLINEAATLETNLKENQDKLSSIKKENKQKEKVINTYKTIYEHQKEIDINQLSNECKLCEGKRFINYDALKNHYLRRHPDYDFEIKFDTQREEKKIGVIEKNLDDLKDQFNTYIQDTANENYIKLLETQRNLENNLNDIKNEKFSINNLQETLEKMNKKLKKLREKKSRTKKEEEFISTSERLSRQINDVHAYNNQKIAKVTKDLDDFRKTVLGQLESAKIGKSDLKISSTFQDFLEFNKYFEKKIEIEKDQRTLLPQKVETLLIPQRKFNANKEIESDYSNFEENEDKKNQILNNMNTSISKIEIKREKSQECAPKNLNTLNNSDHEILNKFDEEPNRNEAILINDNPEMNEEIVKISNEIGKFYEDFSKRDNDIHLKKLKHEEYYQICQIENEEEKQGNHIESLIQMKKNDYNRTSKIDFNDKSKLKKNKMIDFLLNFNKQVEIKSHDDQIYKHYFNKIVSEMNLKEFLTDINVERDKKTEEKRKEVMLSNK